MKKRRVRRKIWGDFIERYKSKDEIKRNKRLFLRREHYDNAQTLSTIKRTLHVYTHKKALKCKVCTCTHTAKR